MRKKRDGNFPGMEKCRKILLIMKLCIVLLLCLSTQTFAEAKAQRVTIRTQKASLEEVIWELQKRTDIIFMYSDDDIASVTDIKLNEKGATLEKILQKCLEGTGLEFVEKNDAIIIKRITEKANFPQQKTHLLKGKVVDSKGSALPGVTVLIKGTLIGTSTDVSGRFSISVPDAKETVVVFSFVGMKTKEVKPADIKDEKILSGEKEYIITLIESAEVLEDVIITGYFNINRSTYAGSVTQVKKEDLLRIDSRNILNAIQFFEPSLRVRENNIFGSDPNALPQFTLRGESSIADKSLEAEEMKLTQRTDMFDRNPNLPIFMLDGFEVNIQTVYDLDINRVESISILKDATATALYGSRAANGVIVITTIAPRPGDLDINYSFGLAATLPDLSDYNMANASEKLEIERLAGLYTAKKGEEWNQPYLDVEYNNKKNQILRGVNTDWLALPLHNAYATTHRFTLQGGVESLRYMIGVNANGTPGVMKGSYRNKYGGDLTVYYNYGKLRLNNVVSYNSTKAEDSPYGEFSTYVKQQPYEEIYDEFGDYLKKFKGLAGDENPLWRTTTKSYSNRDRINDLQNKFIAFYNPFNNFEAKGQVGIQKLDRKLESFQDPSLLKYDYAPAIDKGELYQQFTDSYRWNALFQLRYFPTFGLHNLSLSGAFEISDEKIEKQEATYNGFQLGQFYSPAFAARQREKNKIETSQIRYIGYKALLNYTYSNIAYVNGNINMEGNSQFGSDERFGLYWSIGAGVNIQNLPWFNINKDILTELRLKASYGTTGNVGFEPYAAVTTYAIDPLGWYYMGPASRIVYLGNQNLEGQQVHTTDIGTEVYLWGQRLTLGVEYYHKKTINMIDKMGVQTSSGFVEFQSNGGSLLNEGWEFKLTAIPLQTKNWRVFVVANLARNRDKILKLGAESQRYNELVRENYESQYPEYREAAIRPVIQLYEGVSQNALWAVRSAGIDPANGQEKFIKRGTNASTYTWSADDLVEVGNTEPSANGNFTINVAYKGFYVQSAFAYEWGRSIYNETLLLRVEDVDYKLNNVDKRVLTERWKKPGDVARFLDIKSAYSYLTRTKPSTRFVQTDNILRLGSLSVGYSFDKAMISKWRLKSLELSLNATDVFHLSTVKMERGTSYPFAHNYNFNLRIGF